DTFAVAEGFVPGKLSMAPPSPPCPGVGAPPPAPAALPVRLLPETEITLSPTVRIAPPGPPLPLRAPLPPPLPPLPARFDASVLPETVRLCVVRTAPPAPPKPPLP